MSWKEQILDKLFQDVKEWYDCKGVLHFGFDSTGNPGNWKARPFCGKRVTGWVGFSEIQYSKTDVICPTCLLIYAARQVTKNKEGKE